MRGYVILVAAPELRERLDRVVAATLGSALRPSLGERFDRELARDSTSLYAGESVPAVPLPLPWGVFDVHFRAYLSQSAVVPSQTLAGEGGILAAIARR
jgi:hypothetical protein